jgi:hypothetical protein
VAVGSCTAVAVGSSGVGVAAALAAAGAAVVAAVVGAGAGGVAVLAPHPAPNTTIPSSSSKQQPAAAGRIVFTLFIDPPGSDTTYAVVDLAGICLDKRPDSPPAGRKIPCFFTKMLHVVQHFCEKETERTMLPQAILAFPG